MHHAVLELLLPSKSLLLSQANLCVKRVYRSLVYFTFASSTQNLTKIERGGGYIVTYSALIGGIKSSERASGSVYLLDVLLILHGEGLFIHLPKFLKAQVRSVWLTHWLKRSNRDTHTHQHTQSLQLFPCDKDPDVFDSKADCRVWGN